MKMQSLLILYLFFIQQIFGQTDESWTSFINDENKKGFRDQYGNIVIEAKFGGLTTALKFNNIIGVEEEDTEYYLSKQGKIFGKDSLFQLDNSADCESEGFIRFKDKHSDKIGMFNRFGKVVIPAQYDHLSIVRNGTVVALVGAKKDYWENDKHSGCKHFDWIGGTVLLIDTNNTVLIENFVLNESLNFYSLRRTLKRKREPFKQYWLSKDGYYYSFLDYEKEFESWFKEITQSPLTKTDLSKLLFKKIRFRNQLIEPSKEFIDRNYNLIKARFSTIKYNNCTFEIFNGSINEDSKDFESFYNDCGNIKHWEYPSKNLVITHKELNNSYQDQFQFLRTGEGYKLIEIYLGKE